MAVTINKWGMVLAGVGIITLCSVSYVNSFVYPIISAQPNYQDVERVFGDLKVPETWVQIESSENKGIAGRACPIESDGCFSKGMRFRVLENTGRDDFVKILREMGCSSPVVRETEVVGEKKSYDYECMSGAIKVSGSQVNRNLTKEASIYASSR